MHRKRAKCAKRLRRAAALGSASAPMAPLALFEVLEQRKLLTTITVTSLADVVANDGVVTLREALLASNTDQSPSADTPRGDGHDVIQFAVSGTIPLNTAGRNENDGMAGDLDIIDSVTINGDGIAIDGNFGDRVLDVHPGATLTLNLVNVTQGSAVNGANAAERNGGGIRVAVGATLEMTGGSISNNVAVDGGGVYSADDIHLHDVDIEFNTADISYGGSGGGIFAAGGEADLRHVNLNHNYAYGGNAGGLMAGTDADIRDSTFDSNQAGYDGGGIYADGSLFVQESSFTNNSADESGGALYVHDTADAAIDRTLIRDNTAARGGGIYSANELNVTRSSILNNVAYSDFYGDAGGGGGGIYSTGPLDIQSSTIAGNTSNESSDYGGGILSTVSANIADSTIYDNQSEVGVLGGGIGFAGSLTLQNTIIAENNLLSVESGNDIEVLPNEAGTLTSLGHNFIGVDALASLDITDGLLGDSVGTSGGRIDPMLELRSTSTESRFDAVYGYDIYWIHDVFFPLAGSPVINAGDRLDSFDQRGMARPNDVLLSDIGAVEMLLDGYEFDDVAADATVIIPDGTPHTHSLDDRDSEADWMTFDLTGPSVVVVETTTPTHRFSDATLIRLYILIDGDPVFVADNLYGGPGADARLVAGVGSAGTYFVEVTAYDPYDGPILSYDVSILTTASGDPEEIDIADIDGDPVMDGDLGTTAINNTAFLANTLARDYVITNTGGSALTIDPVTPPVGFIADTQPTALVSPGDSTTLTLTRDATHLAAIDGIVTITNSDSDEGEFTFAVSASALSPHVAVYGNHFGAAGFVSNGQSIPAEDDGTQFGIDDIGNTSAVHEFRVSNLGTGDLFVSELAAPAGFSIASPFSLTVISPGSFASFEIELDDNAPLHAFGDVTFTTNDPISSTYSFTIEGAVSRTAITVIEEFGASVLVNAVAGPGIQVQSQSELLNGEVGAAGLFAGGLAAGLPFDEGIMLSTGQATAAANVNRNFFNDTDFDLVTSSDNDGDGDAYLDGLAGTPTHDAVSLAFDFISDGGDLFFNFIFASEEYVDFVGQEYNDRFAFRLDGENIAVVSDTTTPISVNTINADVNASNYVSNLNGPSMPTPVGFAFDGFTQSLRAEGRDLAPGLHTIELIIADGYDSIYDAAVFIEAGSFVDTEVFVEALDSVATEHLPADTGVVRVSRSSTGGDLVVELLITGDAAIESDYLLNDGSGVDGSSLYLLIPDGEAYVDVVIHPLNDDEVEPDEFVTLTVQPDPDFSIGSPSVATVTIISEDVDEAASVTAVDAVATEGDASDTARFRVTRTQSEGSLTVSFIIGGSAISGVDYTLENSFGQPLAASVVIPDGALSADVIVRTIDNALIEPDETVTFRVTPTNDYAAIAPTFQTVTIIDDDDFPAGVLGDLVYHDANGNRIRDIDEPGLAGVTLAAYLAPLADGDEPLAITTTDPTGAYAFTDLAVGSYIVMVTDNADGDADTDILAGQAGTNHDGSLAATLTTNQSQVLTLDFGFGWKPTADGLIFSSSPATRGESVTISVLNPADADAAAGGHVIRATFFRDLDGDGILNPAVDLRLGIDDSPVGGWSISTHTADLPLGDATFFAVLDDNAGLHSEPIAASLGVTFDASVSAVSDIILEGGDPGVFRISLPSPASQPIALSFDFSGDADDSDYMVLDLLHQPIGGNTITLATGQRQADVLIVAIDDDAFDEADESVVIALRPSSIGLFTLGDDSTAAMTIAANTQAVTPATLDVDGDGEAKLSTDGQLIRMYLTGLLQESTANAIAAFVGQNATRSEPTEITALLADAEFLDVDDNGAAEVESDGQLIRIYMAGLLNALDDAQLSSYLGDGAQRTTVASVDAFLQQYLPQLTSTSDNVVEAPLRRQLLSTSSSRTNAANLSDALPRLSRQQFRLDVPQGFIGPLQTQPDAARESTLRLSESLRQRLGSPLARLHLVAADA